MLKKIISLILMLSLLTLCFASCVPELPSESSEESEEEESSEPSSDPEEKTHTAAEEWSYNETSHYHPCAESGCSEIFDEADHTFTSSKNGNIITYTCSICGYSYTEKDVISLDIPTLSYRSEYTGETIALDLSQIVGYDADTMSISGSLSGEEVNTYTVIVALKDKTDYRWSDGTADDITLTWEICMTIAPNPGYDIDLGTHDYNPNQTLADYSLSEYPDLRWSDSSVVPTCDQTTYLALYNPDPASYSDYYVSVTLTLNPIDPSYTVPTGVEVTLGSKLSVNSIGTGFRYKDADHVAEASDTSFTVIYTPADTVNYNTVEFELSVTVVEVSYPFTVSYSSGTENAYTITQNDDEFTVTFSGITAKSVYSITGELNGNIVIDAGEDYKFELELCGVTVTSAKNIPISILSGDKCTISAKKGTKNAVVDNRDSITDDSEQDEAAIYAECDLEISGKGSLEVTSANNNGIKTKDDFSSKNLTLKVTCMDNAIKGNDSVTIESGTYTLIAKQGDGIKTSNSAKKYEDDGVTLKKIQGTVSITGGEIHIYAACDGIDASYNVEISGEPVIDIYTDKYSEYSEEVTDTSADTYYVKYSSASYKYSIYYYNSDDDYRWVNSSDCKSVSGGMGPGSKTYYYYPMEKPSGYSYMIVYMYSSAQTQGQATSYYMKTSSMTLNSSYDTLEFKTSRYSSSITYGWTNYTTAFIGGGMAPGGGQDGNTNKGDYSTKGIKSSNEILISGGVITIEAYDDAIHTNNDVELGDEDVSGDEYYGTGNITIFGGTVTVSSCDDGIHADGELSITDGTVTVKTSYEGLEGARVLISGGTNSITSSDDGINAVNTAGEAIVISGGVNYVYAGGDGLDSNSRTSYDGMLISGGYTVVINTSGGNSCLDTESGYKHTGGICIGIMPSGGMTGETTRVSTSTGKTTTSLSSAAYVTFTVSGSVVCSVKMPKSMKMFAIYLGSSNCSITTGSSSSYSYDSNGVYWNS